MQPISLMKIDAKIFKYAIGLKRENDSVTLDIKSFADKEAC